MSQLRQGWQGFCEIFKVAVTLICVIAWLPNSSLLSWVLEQRAFTSARLRSQPDRQTPETVGKHSATARSYAEMSSILRASL